VLVRDKSRFRDKVPRAHELIRIADIRQNDTEPVNYGWISSTRGISLPPLFPHAESAYSVSLARFTTSCTHNLAFETLYKVTKLARSGISSTRLNSRFPVASHNSKRTHFCHDPISDQSTQRSGDK